VANVCGFTPWATAGMLNAKKAINTIAARARIYCARAQFGIKKDAKFGIAYSLVGKSKFF
jgi:hypothetical protein